MTVSGLIQQTDQFLQTLGARIRETKMEQAEDDEDLTAALGNINEELRQV